MRAKPKRDDPEYMGCQRLAMRSTVGFLPQSGACAVRDIESASGVLLQWRNKPVIVTARHYLDKFGPEKLSVTFCPERIVEAGSMAALKSAVQSHDMSEAYRAQPLRFGRVARCDNRLDDLAVVEVDPEQVPRAAEAHDIASIHAEEPPANEWVFVVGLPVSTRFIKKEVSEGGAKGHLEFRSAVFLKPSYVKEEAETDRWVDDDGQPAYDPARHMSVHFDQSKLPEKDRIDPRGMSGCGVWNIDPGNKAKQGQVWKPRIELVGIQVSHLGIRKSLKVTKVGCLMEVLGKL